MKGFFYFIKEQGVVGLAVGFILGSAISEFVSSLVTNILNPFVSLFFISFDNLHQAQFTIRNATFFYGSFLVSLIDFIVLALVVYLIFKKLAGTAERIVLRKTKSVKK